MTERDPSAPADADAAGEPRPWLTRETLGKATLRSGVLAVAMAAGQLSTDKPFDLAVGALFVAGFVGLANLPLALLEQHLRREAPLPRKEALKGATLTYFFGGVLFAAAWFQAHYTDALVYGKGLTAATEAVQSKLQAFLSAPWQLDAWFFMATLPAPFAAFAYARLRHHSLLRGLLLCVLSPLPLLIVARPASANAAYAWGVLGSALVALPAAAAIADHEPRRKVPLVE
ncbi:MAG: hypothetical protein KDD82_03085 [Planctomycetes bacterium]|nr:hypothetical protein [Planctomycetota bacterium]